MLSVARECATAWGRPSSKPAMIGIALPIDGRKSGVFKSMRKGAVFGALILLAVCGGGGAGDGGGGPAGGGNGGPGGGGGGPTPVVQVTISPAEASVAASATQQFACTVTRSSNSACT